MPRNRVHILYIITQSAWGGAQRYVADLIASLPADYAISLAIGEARESDQIICAARRLRQDIHIIHLKHLVRRISPLHDILAVSELTRLYRQIKPNIIHANSSKAGIIASFAAWCRADKTMALVYTAHGWVFNESLHWLRKSLYKFLERLTLKAKKRVIVLTQSDYYTAKKTLEAEASQLALIPLGIANETCLQQTQARQELHRYIERASNKQTITHDNKNYWIGCIANFYHTKGVDILIQAAAKLPDHLRQDSRLIIIGNGPERDKLEKLVKKMNLADFVYLTGFISEISKLLTAFDLIVIPSRKEGLPYSLLESCQAGIPVIATRVGGIPSFITDKINGLLVPPEDPQSLAQAISFAYDKPNVVKQLAERAKNQSLNYTLDKEVTSTVELYNSLLTVKYD